MAEDDRSQLPLPSPGSPAEERKQRKSTSELREISEETYELRKTAAGEYEKKTTKSERHERKTSDEETFVATGLPSPTVSLARWHEQVPERVKLEVSGVTADGCPDAPGLDADYILDLLDRRPEKCRWEYTFRAKCQLFRCCLEAFPDADGKLTLRAFFEGSVAGPVWTQTGLRDLSGRVVLTFDHGSAENPSAGCRWPETLTATPLAAAAATKRFYISPEPTQQEMAAMASSGSGSISSSAGRRLILLFGYWPPTDIGVSGRHGMLWEARERKAVTFGEKTYDVLAISPEFPKEAPGPPYNPQWGRGSGAFTIDYNDTSEQFWALVGQHTPIAIMAFGRAEFDTKWVLEEKARNLAQADWYPDFRPSRPRAGGSQFDPAPPSVGHQSRPGDPPDPTEDAGTPRSNNLPMGEIVSGIQSVFTAAEVNPSIDTSGDAGNFLCEYLGYHVAWYRHYINAEYPDDPDKKCLRSGFTHVGGNITAANAETAVRIQLEKLFDVLP